MRRAAVRRARRIDGRFLFRALDHIRFAASERSSAEKIYASLDRQRKISRASHRNAHNTDAMTLHFP